MLDYINEGIADIIDMNWKFQINSRMTDWISKLNIKFDRSIQYLHFSMFDFKIR